MQGKEEHKPLSIQGRHTYESLEKIPDDLNLGHTEVVRDNWNLCWIFCVMMGIAQLFPWNAFITAYDYWKFLFSSFPIMFAYPIANNWGALGAYFAVTKWGYLASTKVKLYVSYFITFSVLALVPIIDLSGINTSGMIAIDLIMCLIAGCCSAVMTSTTFGVVAHLPPEYTGALMTGQGLAGVIVGILKLCMNFWWLPNLDDPTEQQLSGVLYFGIGAIIILICTVATAVLMKMKFYIYHSERRHIGETTESASPLINVGVEKSLETFAEPTLKGVFKKIWVDALSVFVVFFITLSLFPGFTLRIRNYDEALGENFGVILIALFQVCDFIGRFTPRFIQFPRQRFLFIPVWSRLIFYPLFMIAIYTGWFSSNYIAYTFVIIFAFSNGYISTLGMMYGSSNSSIEPEEKEMAGSMMGLALQIGVFTGVHAAFIFLFCAEGAAAIGF